MLYKLVASSLFFLCTVTSAKILVFTCTYNRPDFIEIQQRTLQAFLQEEYDFVVFDDSRDPAITDATRHMCQRLDIQYVKIPQAIHDQPYLERGPGEDYNHPTVRNVNAVQYFLNTMGFVHDDIVFLLDSDLFLVKPFSIREFMDGYDMGGRQLGRGSREANDDINYIWHGLTFLDMRRMPNRFTLTFNAGKINGLAMDGGGFSHYYIQNNPTLNIRYIDHNFSDELMCDQCKQQQNIYCTHNGQALKQVGLNDVQIAFIQATPVGGIFYASSVEFFHNNSFLHYRCGSNWDGKTAEYHAQKTEALNRYIEAIIGQ